MVSATSATRTRLPWIVMFLPTCLNAAPLSNGGATAHYCTFTLTDVGALIVCCRRERRRRPRSPRTGEDVDGDQCDDDAIEGKEGGSSGREYKVQVDHSLPRRRVRR